MSKHVKRIYQLVSDNRLAEAIDAIEQRLGKEKSNKDTLYKLAIQSCSSLGLHKKMVMFAIDMCVEIPSTKAMNFLASSLNIVSVNQYSPDLENAFLQLKKNETDLESLYQAVLVQLYLKYDWKGLSVGTEQVVSAVTAMAADDLLVWFLRVKPIQNLTMVYALRDIRKWFLSQVMQDVESISEWVRIADALATQCFDSDYLNHVSDEEESELAELITMCQASEVDQHLRNALVVYAMYCPIIALQGPVVSRLENPVKEIARLNVYRRTYIEPLVERELHKNLSVFGEMPKDIVSDMYNQFPFPRWKKPRKIDGYETIFKSLKVKKVRDLCSAPNVLIAGCGTGRHAIEVALANPKATIVGIDISKASLAYAERMNQKYKLKNLSFVLSDIKEYCTAHTRRYQIIESVGVLHHTPDQWRYLDYLQEALTERGLLRVGLYSSMARQSITDLRLKLRNREGYPPKSSADIRLLWKLINDDFRASLESVDRPLDIGGILGNREKLNAMDSDTVDYSLYEELKYFDDFYNLYMFNDLICNVREATTNIDEIAERLAARSLEFFCMEPRRALSKQESEKYTDLQLLKKMESSDPTMFYHMYSFWCGRNT